MVLIIHQQNKDILENQIITNITKYGFNRLVKMKKLK